MALLCGSLFRSSHFTLLSSHLIGNLRVCRRAVYPQSSWRTTISTSVRLRASLTGRTTSYQIYFKATAPLPCGPVLTPCGHCFHTSARLRALPAPLIWMIIKPLQKIMAIILGRSIRKWWVALPDNRRQLMRKYAWQKRWHLAGGAGVAIMIVALFLLTHLDESPLTGRTRLLVFSKENYMEMAALTSDAYMEEYAELLVPVTDPRHQVVERVVQLLAQRNKDIPEVSDISWTVHVVQSPNVNAFVLPNGSVFMFTGMLEAIADAHQLTIILGHEMAHALLGHAAEQASVSHVLELLSVVLLIAIWAMCPHDSLSMLGHWVQGKLRELLFHRPFSRKLEAEADQVGLQLAAKACADVRAGPVFWQQMELRDQLSGEPTLPEWLSTHPSHRNRVVQLDRLIPEALELRERCVCPALPATDPRDVFSKSVRVLLENTREQRSEGPERGDKPLLTRSPTSVPTRLPAAFLAQTALPSSPDADQLSKGPVPAAVPERVMAARATATAAEEGSQHVLQSTS
ncbi:cytochrome c oxidase subunit 6a [Sarotherodon galilaeus]